MKLLVDIPDSKARMMLDLLKSISFVKTAIPFSKAKSERIERIQDAVREINEVKKGLRKPLLLKDALNGL